MSNCFDTMKLFVVLFAFLAVQASARVIDEAGIPEEILEFIETADLSELFADLPEGTFDEFTADGTAASPEKCLPYIEPAYKAAVEVRRIIGKARELGKKLKEAAKKCKGLTKPDDKKKCFEDLKKQAVAEGKPLKEAFDKVKPQIVDLMSKMDKCMAGQTEEVAAPTDAQKCLPYVEEAYKVAVEMRGLIQKGMALGKKLKAAAEKCKAMTKPEDKKKCFQDLMKMAKTEGKPLKDAYMKIRPKIGETMAKFDKCMA